jgi:hypothetical protein
MSKTGDIWTAVFSNKLSFHADFYMQMFNRSRYCKQIVFLEKPFIAQLFFPDLKLG